MDFQYTFRQAYQDRLEEAGVIQFRPVDIFKTPGRARHSQPDRTDQRRRLIFATILNIISR